LHCQFLGADIQLHGSTLQYSDVRDSVQPLAQNLFEIIGDSPMEGSREGVKMN
jgi:hypothetical protein